MVDVSKYVEAPTEFTGTGPSLFLAGGISGCPDWQAAMRLLMVRDGLKDKWHIINPRRAAFDRESIAGEEQVAWEYRHLRRATAIAFWFPKDTICPIVLFELGSWLMLREKLIYIGIDPVYSRRLDVEQQVQLARPELIIEYSLESHTRRVVNDLNARY